jgi:hypothetical protein
MLETYDLKRFGTSIVSAFGNWFTPIQAAAICVRIIDDTPYILLISNRARTRVEACLETFPEAGMREIKWISLAKAADLVGYDELATALTRLGKGFDV